LLREKVKLENISLWIIIIQKYRGMKLCLKIFGKHPTLLDESP
jgi:hypothetical protein